MTLDFTILIEKSLSFKTERQTPFYIIRKYLKPNQADNCPSILDIFISIFAFAHLSTFLFAIYR